jgi:hypothetical protein
VPNGFSRIVSRQSLATGGDNLKHPEALPMDAVGPVGDKAKKFVRGSTIHTMNTKSILSVFAVLLMNFQAGAQVAPSSDDVWDVSQGTILILSTDLSGAPSSTFDMRDMFGGGFGTTEADKGNILFADGTPEDSVHIIQWRVRKELVVKSFRLFAYDDPQTGDHGFKTFRLKAKTLGSLTFDTILFEGSPKHPYQYEDKVQRLLIAGNVQPVLAQEFLAEFTTWNGPGGSSANGPRIMELDGFTDVIAMHPEIRASETEVSWVSAPGVTYVIQYRERLDETGSWHQVGAPIAGTGAKMTINDHISAGTPERFYRVVTLDETLQ